jgi:hypothetical protein
MTPDHDDAFSRNRDVLVRRSRIVAVIIAVIGVAASVAADSKWVALVTIAVVIVTIVGTRIYLLRRWGPPPSRRDERGTGI